MKSPWKSVQPLDPGREYLALVTDIPPRSRISTGRLFRGARAVQHQLAATEGVAGFSLLARPVKKQYVTLSMWDSEETLAQFAHAGPHGTLMTELGAEMAPTTFVRWKVSGADGRPTWREGLRRLAAAQQNRSGQER